jgi:UPF0716 family protein affecting phage T7 exclusion
MHERYAVAIVVFWAVVGAVIAFATGWNLSRSWQDADLRGVAAIWDALLESLSYFWVALPFAAIAWYIAAAA